MQLVEQISATAPELHIKPKRRRQGSIASITQWLNTSILDPTTSTDTECDRNTTTANTRSSIGNAFTSLTQWFHNIDTTNNTTTTTTLPNILPNTTTTTDPIQPPHAHKNGFGNLIRIILIKGREGSGKTTVIRWLRKQANDRNIPHFSVRLNSKDNNNNYYIWKKLFSLLMPKDFYLTMDTQRTYIKALLSEIFPNAKQVGLYIGYPVLKAILGVTCTYTTSSGSTNNSSKHSSSNTTNTTTSSSTTGTSTSTTNNNTTTNNNNTTTTTNNNKTTTSNKEYKNTWIIRKNSIINKEKTLSETQIFDVLYKIFNYLLNIQTCIVIIENTEHCDENSLKFLIELSKLQSKSAIILTSLEENNNNIEEGSGHGRSFFHSKPIQISYKTDAIKNSYWNKIYNIKLYKLINTTIIILENYSIDEINKMLCETLGVQTVSTEIIQLVQDFSGGSYFWVREILQFITEHGCEQFISAVGEKDVNITNTGIYNSIDDIYNQTSNQYNIITTPYNRQIRIKPSPTSGSNNSISASPMANNKRNSNHMNSSTRQLSRIASLRAPTSIRNNDLPHQIQLDKLILCRFGNLNTNVQRILRTASIIGMTFNSIILYNILTTQLKEQLNESIQILLNQRWLYQDTQSDNIYQFAHIHAHQIIYELTPTSERSNIHLTIAMYIENTYINDKTQYGILSYHYQHCDHSKALMYATLATEILLQVQSIFDYGDCIDLLTGSVQCCKTKYDIEILNKLIQQARTSIRDYNINKIYEEKSLPWYYKLYYTITQFHYCSNNNMKYKHKRSSIVSIDNNSDYSEEIVYEYGAGTVDGHEELTDRDTGNRDPGNTPTNHNTSSTASSLHEQKEIDYEKRTKRMLLQQLHRLTDQLSERYVDITEVHGGNGGEIKDWQMIILAQGSATA